MNCAVLSVTEIKICLKNAAKGGDFLWKILCTSENAKYKQDQRYIWMKYAVYGRRQWHPTPVLLPGNSHGQRSLVSYIVHGVAMSRTRLNDFTFTFNFHALEKEMATHSGVLAWRFPGMGEPGGLPSLGSHRVGHDWSDLAAAAVACCIWGAIKSHL